jgi:hypothetical protein
MVRPLSRPLVERHLPRPRRDSCGPVQVLTGPGPTIGAIEQTINTLHQALQATEESLGREQLWRGERLSRSRMRSKVPTAASAQTKSWRPTNPRRFMSRKNSSRRAGANLRGKTSVNAAPLPTRTGLRGFALGRPIPRLDALFKGGEYLQVLRHRYEQ